MSWKWILSRLHVYLQWFFLMLLIFKYSRTRKLQILALERKNEHTMNVSRLSGKSPSQRRVTICLLSLLSHILILVENRFVWQDFSGVLHVLIEETRLEKQEGWIWDFPASLYCFPVPSPSLSPRDRTTLEGEHIVPAHLVALESGALDIYK